MGTNKRVGVMVIIKPIISLLGRGEAAVLVREVEAQLRYRPAVKIRGDIVKARLTRIAAEDLASNYLGVLGCFLSTLRMRIDKSLYVDLLDDDLACIAESRSIEDLAQQVADQAQDPAGIDSDMLRSRLGGIAKLELDAELKAARGAFLAQLEMRLPEHTGTYETLLDGPLAFLTVL